MGVLIIDNLVNIDLQPVADVVNNLINKMAEGVGWCFTRPTLKTIARETLVAEIQQLNISPLDRAAFISKADIIIREYSNQNNIVQMAIPLLTENSKPEEIDDDWLNEFMDKARLVSDEDFQLLWARILAGEAEHKNSFSIRTLNKVKSMSKREAEIFQKVAKLAIGNQMHRGVFIDSKINNDHNLSIEDIATLDECGFMSMNALGLNLSNTENSAVLMDSKESLLCVINCDKWSCSENYIYLYPFTKSGLELLNAIVVEPEDSYFIDVVKRLKMKYKTNKDIEVCLYKVESVKEDGIHYDDHDMLEDNFELG